MRRENLLMLVLVATAGVGCSQPPSPAAVAGSDAAPATPTQPSGEPGWTGLTEPDEVIEARRVLMTEAERLMKPIDGFPDGEPADAAQLRENATSIEALLLAAPHLFPPTTNKFDPAAHDPPTTALPTVWQRFPAFLTFADSAEKAAAALREAEGEDALRAASTRLRGACDACHAGFMKPYTPPVVTEEDKEFDFESVLPPQ